MADSKNSLDVSAVAQYTIWRQGDERCEHTPLLPVSDGDAVPCFRLPVPCAGCRGRFNSMVLTEADYVLERCVDGLAWVCRVPADDDPSRDEWHLLVGHRIQAFGSMAAAFVVQNADETAVVSTHPLWGCGGRMLKSRWSRLPTAEVSLELMNGLEDGDINRAEMFHRPQFFRWLMAFGRRDWAVPLADQALLDLLDGNDLR
jgi:hypothetical protein